MVKQKQKPATIPIVGMHRSGTSLTTNWLNGLGLNVGNSLYAATKDNPAGHFEDNDFLEFHRDILHKNGYIDYKVNKSPTFHYSKYHKEKAAMLIQLKNKLQTQWGWKEPRTALLLDFWHPLLNNPKYLFIYRNYSTTVDSLLRREYSKFDRPGLDNKVLSPIYKIRYKNRITDYKNKFLQIWIISFYV